MYTKLPISSITLWSISYVVKMLSVKMLTGKLADTPHDARLYLPGLLYCPLPAGCPFVSFLPFLHPNPCHPKLHISCAP